jgi:hypothetical protein
MQKIVPPQPGDENYDHVAASMAHGIWAVIVSTLALFVLAPLCILVFPKLF